VTPLVFGAMLASAFLHAAWNAWVKSRGDSTAAVSALVIGAGFPYLVILFFVGLPPLAAWGWITLTVGLSIVSLTLLAAAYREGDFAVAYPMIRGLIPVVLVLAAAPLFGEVLTLPAAFGVLCVSAGLGLIAWESARRTRTMTLKGLGFAALAASFTAAMVIADAKGARLSDHPVAYAGTIAVLNALAMALVQRLRGHSVPSMLARHWPITIFGAVLSNTSYVLFVWSLQQAPVALVAALRETSMLFALLIAVVMMRERVGAWRLAAVAVMMTGAVLIRS